MEILNETVYDTSDLLALVKWAQEVGHKLESQQRLANYQKRNSTYPYHPPRMRAMPSKMRFGYYNQSESDRGENGPQYAKMSGSQGRENLRLGIVKHTKMPMPAMLVIAHAAAEPDQRCVPQEVLEHIAIALCSHFGYSTYYEKSRDKVRAEIGPELRLRYRHRRNRAEAKAAKADAAKRRLGRARSKVAGIECEVHSLRRQLREKEAELQKAKQALRKLEPNEGLSYVR